MSNLSSPRVSVREKAIKAFVDSQHEQSEFELKIRSGEFECIEKGRFAWGQVYYGLRRKKYSFFAHPVWCIKYHFEKLSNFFKSLRK